jgi:hypothetical protein
MPPQVPRGQNTYDRFHDCSLARRKFLNAPVLDFRGMIAPLGPTAM